MYKYLSILHLKDLLKTQGEREMVGSHVSSLREKISPWVVLNDTAAFGC